MADRSLTTVLFTDIVGSTELLSELGDRSWRRLLERHDRLVVRCVVKGGGRVVNTTGDGFVAVFDAPGDAIRCAHEAIHAVAKLELTLRAGIHTGECEMRGDDIAGIAVNVASRVADHATASEILVTGTVRDLVAGGDVTFRSRGTVSLKGIAGRRAVYAADVPAHAPSRPSKKGAPRSPGVSVLLVDDHPLWRRTLRQLLERSGFEVRGEAGSAAEAVTEASRLDPDVVVIDLDMPGAHGTVAIAELIAARPDRRVLVLSSSDERDDVVRATRAGAHGYLLKTADEADVRDAITRVGRGELVFPPALAELVLAELRSPVGLPSAVLLAARPLQRRGLAAALGERGHQVLDAPDDIRAAAVVVVALVGDTDDAELLRRAYAMCPPALGVLAVLDDVRHGRAIKPTLAAGRGFGCLVSPDESRLSEGVRRVAAGEVVLDPAASSMLSPPVPSLVALLSERERQILELMAAGRGNQAIAREVHVSAKTVEAHINSIFTKLGLDAGSDDHRRVRAVVAFLDRTDQG